MCPYIGTRWRTLRRQSGTEQHRTAAFVLRRTYPIPATEKSFKPSDKVLNRHSPVNYLIKRLDFGVHYKWELAEFTSVWLGLLQPLLQAVVMYEFHWSRTVTGREKVYPLAFTVANSADAVTALLGRLAAAGAEPEAQNRDDNRVSHSAKRLKRDLYLFVLWIVNSSSPVSGFIPNVSMSSTTCQPWYLLLRLLFAQIYYKITWKNTKIYSSKFLLLLWLSFSFFVIVIISRCFATLCCFDSQTGGANSNRCQFQVTCCNWL